MEDKNWSKIIPISFYNAETARQLSRDTEITRMSPRDTDFKLPISRNMVYLQDHMANQGVI